MLQPTQGSTSNSLNPWMSRIGRPPPPPVSAPSLPEVTLEYIMNGVYKPNVIPEMSERVCRVMKAFRPSVKYGDSLYQTPAMEDGSIYELDYVGAEAFVRIFQKAGLLYSLTPLPANAKITTFLKTYVSSENILAEWEAWAAVYEPGELRVTALERIKDCVARNTSVVNLGHLNLYSMPQYLPPNIKTLILRFNYLTTLPFLHDGLECVCAHFNRLSTLPPDYPASLKELDVNFNRITSLPDFPATLTSIYLNGNKLKNFRGLPRTATLLELGDNPVDSDKIPDFSQFRNLNTLGLQKLGLKKFPSVPPTLHTLYVDSNPLRQIPDLTRLNQLRVLAIDDTKITQLPPLPQTLTELCARDNKISSLPPLPSSLKTLLISLNKLTVVEELPSSLEEVDLCHNKLSRFCADLPNLRELKLANNKITHLEGPLSRKLTLLDITHNQIRVIPSLPPTLVELHIEFNKLIAPPRDDLPALKSFSDEVNRYHDGVRAVREDLHLSEQEVADALKINVMKIVQIEQCDRDIKLGMWKRYAEAMGCYLSLDIKIEEHVYNIPLPTKEQITRDRVVY